ncbi:MAG: hypothetical protein PVI06_10680 [Desulfobacterales bacterium]
MGKACPAKSRMPFRQISSRSDIGFASAGLPGRSLVRRLVAEEKICVRQRVSIERSERAVN